MAVRANYQRRMSLCILAAGTAGIVVITPGGSMGAAEPEIRRAIPLSIPGHGRVSTSIHCADCMPLRLIGDPHGAGAEAIFTIVF